ncbi:hypothetical protein WMF27_33120 [Sorangium sp. So ce281]|uniref:hypothetical protein n=1 Tax=unclassified Sorangium TaxID=2621164 RepID=UPI003F6382F0
MEDNTLFDIEIVRTCPREPEGHALTLLDKYGKREAWRSRGLVGVKLGLRDAQEIARQLRKAGGAALVLPCRYSAPTVSLAAARLLAEKRLEEIKLTRGDVFGPLENGHEQWMWWRFYAEHIPSREEGREPGCIFIDIDKLDGHVAHEKDAEEYARWQTL